MLDFLLVPWKIKWAPVKTCLRIGAPVEDQENLAFSDDFYNKFCELKDWFFFKKFFLSWSLSCL